MPAFAGELFGPGQPLDASRFFIIILDAIGTGGSAKPSEGMRAKFSEYNYADMVAAQYRLVTEGLGLKHVRLWKSGSVGERPRVNRELRGLVLRMAAENPLLGAPRIHGELLKLGFELAQSTVSNYLRRHPRPR
jgi:hypothetical protein